MTRLLLTIFLLAVLSQACMSTAILPTNQSMRTAYKAARNAPDTNPTITPAPVLPIHLLETGGTGKIEMEMTK